MGCSERDSADMIAPRTSGSPSNPVTAAIPSVTVPVLSRMTESTRPHFSRDAASLNSMPCSAAFPEPTAMARGVARPSAQGHEITRTVIITLIEYPADSPDANQSIADINPTRITAGTKTDATRSAILATGALVALASSISLAISDIMVSSPSPSTEKRNAPPRFTVPV